MREPQVFKPPLEVAEKGRRRAGNWHGAFLLTAVTVIVATFLAGTWQPPRWAVIALIGVLGVLGTMTVGLLVNTLNRFWHDYRLLWADYETVFSEHAKRVTFMVEFSPPFETVDKVLRDAAYEVFRHHREIAWLHEEGIVAPQAGDPDTQREALKRNFNEKVQGLEDLMRHALDRFRALRDNAKWAGEQRYHVRKSWWDYIDPKDLPKKARRSDRTGLSTPIDTSGNDLVRSRRALEQAREGLVGSPRPQNSCGCPPDDCPHGPVEGANELPGQ